MHKISNSFSQTKPFYELSMHCILNVVEQR